MSAESHDSGMMDGHCFTLAWLWVVFLFRFCTLHSDPVC